MGSLGATIQNTLSMQDLELAQAITELKKNPTKLNSFVQARRNELFNTVKSEHSDTFQKVYGDLERATNTQNNIFYYFVRNKDLDLVEKSVYDKASADAANAKHDAELAKRQYEMNEWASNNKLDTLFVFQMVLIALTLTAPLLYLQRTGVIPMTVLVGVVSLVLLAILFTIIVRAQYTIFTRDSRYWNRRKFASMGGPPTVPTCESVSALAAEAAVASKNLASQASSFAASATAKLT